MKEQADRLREARKRFITDVQNILPENPDRAAALRKLELATRNELQLVEKIIGLRATRLRQWMSTGNVLHTLHTPLAEADRLRMVLNGGEVEHSADLSRYLRQVYREAIELSAAITTTAIQPRITPARHTIAVLVTGAAVLAATWMAMHGALSSSDQFLRLGYLLAVIVGAMAVFAAWRLYHLRQHVQDRQAKLRERENAQEELAAAIAEDGGARAWWSSAQETKESADGAHRKEVMEQFHVSLYRLGGLSARQSEAALWLLEEFGQIEGLRTWQAAELEVSVGVLEYWLWLNRLKAPRSGPRSLKAATRALLDSLQGADSTPAVQELREVEARALAAATDYVLAEGTETVAREAVDAATKRVLAAKSALAEIDRAENSFGAAENKLRVAQWHLERASITFRRASRGFGLAFTGTVISLIGLAPLPTDLYLVAAATALITGALLATAGTAARLAERVVRGSVVAIGLVSAVLLLIAAYHGHLITSPLAVTAMGVIGFTSKPKGRTDASKSRNDSTREKEIAGLGVMTRPFSIEEHRNLVRVLRPLLNQLSSVKYPQGAVRLNWAVVDKRFINAGLRNVGRRLITYVLFDDHSRLWTVGFEHVNRYIDDLIRERHLDESFNRDLTAYVDKLRARLQAEYPKKGWEGDEEEKSFVDRLIDAEVHRREQSATVVWNAPLDGLTRLHSAKAPKRSGTSQSGSSGTSSIWSVARRHKSGHAYLLSALAFVTKKYVGDNRPLHTLFREWWLENRDAPSGITVENHYGRSRMIDLAKEAHMALAALEEMGETDRRGSDEQIFLVLLAAAQKAGTKAPLTEFSYNELRRESDPRADQFADDYGGWAVLEKFSNTTLRTLSKRRNKPSRTTRRHAHVIKVRMSMCSSGLCYRLH